MSLNQTSYNVALLSLLLGYSSSATSMGDQWYLGIGGGTSLLRSAPSATTSDIELEYETDGSATFFFGRDFGDRSSAQLQLYSLGEAKFNNADTVTYNAGDATVLYRFYDSRDISDESSLGISMYGRLGFGYVGRKSDTALENGSTVYFGAGAGIETYFTRNVGVRLEGFYHEVDAASLHLSLVTRFGGVEKPTALPEPSPSPNPEKDPIDSDKTYLVENPLDPIYTDTPPTVSLTQPEQTIYPEPIVANNDRDEDGVLDSQDRCPATLKGDPVDNEGCYIFSQSEPIVSKNDKDSDGVLNANDQCPNTLKGYPVDDVGCFVLTIPQQSPLNNDTDADGVLNANDQCPTTLKGYPVDSVGCFNLPKPTPESSTSSGKVPSNSNSPYAAQVPGNSSNPVTRYPDHTAVNNDIDEDGVLDRDDRCSDTLKGYPVDKIGCSVFTNLANGLIFIENSPNLTADAVANLNQLAFILKLFPHAGVELIAHTDSSRTDDSQSRLTERRLRNIGIYLLARGVKKNQLLLRFFADEQPAFEGSTAYRRRESDRIEARELDMSRRR